MSLEKSIAELLEQRRTAEAEPLEEAYPGAGSNKEDEPAMQGSSEKASFEIVNKGTGGNKAGAGGNRLAPGVAAKEAKPMKQGSSQEPGWEDLDSAKVGIKAAANAKETDKKPLGKGAGAAPNFATKVDPTKEVNKASSSGNRGEPGRKTFEAIQSMFADEQTLTEEFKTKAVGLFEALVNAGIAEVREELEAEAAAQAVDIIVAKEQELTEQVDRYLDYIAEQWMEKNEAVVANALKVELAESFFAGLRALYEEHYVTLPEGGTDVVTELQNQVDELTTELNATIEAGVEVQEEVNVLRKSALLAEASVGLALTEAERLVKLCESVEFEDDDTFTEKVKVIRESYFPAAGGAAKPLTEQKSAEVEEPMAAESDEEQPVSPEMEKYVSAIHRQAAF